MISNMRMFETIHNFFNISIKNILLILLIGGFLSSCSLSNISSITSVPSIPNWVKPSNALKKVSGIFSRYRSERDLEKKDEKISLEDVPERPKSTILSKRDETISGLRSDSKNAKYIDETDEVNSKVLLKVEDKPSSTKIKKNQDDNRKISSDKNLKKSQDSLNSRRIITSGKLERNSRVIADSNKRVIEPKKLEGVSAESKIQEKKKLKNKQELVTLDKGRSSNSNVITKRNETIDIDNMIEKGYAKSGENTVQTTFSKLIEQSNSKVSNVPIGREFQTTKAKAIMPEETLAKPVLRELYNSSIIIDSSANNAENIKKIQESKLNLSSFSNYENLEPKLTINFAHDSKNLSRSDKLKLKNLVEQYGSKLRSIVVIGHASSRTRDMNIFNHQLVNFKISVDRAQSVASQLIEFSIPASLIKIEARGSSEPKYFESMPSGEAANRRTEIFIVESSS